ncbi:trypsin-like serine protease [Actinosynnema sp. NPDC047251]|uniref:Peptidase, S1/S6 family n=1 Tax=Saccharothrix espanaensis (strain ATCC 51144 / DSM 44229 / JCM 9112 / NBRC 15066 / NRRL 15764) TaxID=1179773 RepID=K0K475_SACES|nr:trypsin-like serine protease [Saccharothrix espanaensis]CCH31639.1 Peptidase, S1/S6 family [Saccharothrix espanaensis DSM 44229]
MNIRTIGVLATVGAAFGAALLTPNAAAAPEYDPAMLAALAADQGSSPRDAAARLDREHDLTRALADLRTRGVQIDGAFFDRAGRLVANTSDPAAVAAAGLTPRTAARGERALDALTARVERAIGADLGQVQAWGPDVVGDRVLVTVEPDATSALVATLSRIDGVAVERGAARLAPQADVVPGRIMDLVPGTNCSLGFPGTRNGAKVLLTAGHCVEGNPDILDANGTHIGKGIATRFPSYDMGLMSIDPEDTGRGYVDTRKGTTVAVKGMSKAAVGATLCKAGNTTGWTCGKVSAYNQTVRYSGESTSTRGLARSTVCTEGGDSGGAYISGNTAQGMTSGGPSDGHDCGWNQGSNATGSYSYYQPVVDAANYYGVTLTTS